MTITKSISIFALFLSLFCMQVYAQTDTNKNVVMVSVSNVYSTFPPSILRLVIKQDSIERFLDDPVCSSQEGIVSCDFANRKGEIVNYPENLLRQIPQEFLKGSNNIHSSLNDGGGFLIVIFFDDGSKNSWGIFQSSYSYSPEIQSFLQKIATLLSK